MRHGKTRHGIHDQQNILTAITEVFGNCSSGKGSSCSGQGRLIRRSHNDYRSLQSALSKGDRVLTQAGIYGTVVGVEEDKVVLRVDDNVKLEFQRSTIVGVAGEAKK